MQSGGSLLAEWMDKRGYAKQADVAKTFKISEALISMLLSSKRAPGRDLALRIQDRTGIPVGAWNVKTKSQSRKPRQAKHHQASGLQGVM